jgi:hypothetical protein
MTTVNGATKKKARKPDETTRIILAKAESLRDNDQEVLAARGIIEYFYNNEREELEAYVLTTYDVDVTEMPKSLIFNLFNL